MKRLKLKNSGIAWVFLYRESAASVRLAPSKKAKCNGIAKSFEFRAGIVHLELQARFQQRRKACATVPSDFDSMQRHLSPNKH